MHQHKKICYTKVFVSNVYVILIFFFNSVAAQTITTYAGNGIAGYNGDNKPATQAELLNPYGVAIGNDNNLYIADNSNNRIRKVDAATKIITTIVGLGTNGGNCALNQAGLANPRGIAFDKYGNMYITDASTCIRKVDVAAQTITTIAGRRGIPNIYGNVLGDNGPAVDAYFDGAAGIAIDRSGNIFVADMGNGRIRKIDVATGIITTFAGGASFDPGEGHLATEASLSQPLSAAFDSKGNLYIADVGNDVIRKVDAVTNIISVIAGQFNKSGYNGDGGLAANALLNTPTAVTLDKDDNIYITDCFNNRIRKIDNKTGIITTIAGTGVAGYAGDCGPAKNALLNWPWSITLDKAGQTYFTELKNSTVRKIAADQPDLISGAETICMNDSIVLTAAEPGGIWASNNAAVAFINSNGVVHGVAAGTTVINYTINLGGCEMITASHNISVNAINENAAIISSQKLCTADTLTLHQTVSGGVWYGDNPSVVSVDAAGYLQCLGAGTAELKYLVKKSCAVTNKVSVQVFKPQPLFLGNDTSICKKTSFTIDAGNSFIKYNWSTTDTTQSITVNTAGIYGLKATDNNNCTVSDSLTIKKVLDMPLINWPPDSAFCTGGKLILIAPPNIQSSIWQDGTLAPSYTVIKAGSYSVMATGTNGCINTASIQIDERPPPSFSLGNDTALCAAKTLSYDFNLPDAGYLWNDGSASNKYVINKQGTYWLNVNQRGCSASDTINITYLPAPVVNIGNDTMLCENTTKLLTAKTNNATYLWQDGSKQDSYLVNKTGQYYVTATLNNCSTADTINISYQQIPSFAFGPDVFLCKGQQLKLEPAMNTAVNYLWQDGSNKSSFTVNSDGKYILKVLNRCGNFSDSIKVTTGLCNLTMPSAFTPDRDGLNDVFRVKYVFPVKQFNMIIYNRWGQKIFESSDINRGWDGTFKGILASADTYVWIISLTDTEDKSQTKHGTITLVK